MVTDIAHAEPAVAHSHFAFARCAPSDEARGDIGDIDDEVWLAACRRLTPRVERVAPTCALLDLGVCSDDEAFGALRAFHTSQVARGFRVRLGLGPTATLAQLALLTARGRRGLAHVPRETAAAFLRPVPVAALAQLHPAGCITAETVERLRRYGLTTLGHLARLEERALRRQFGADVGAFLATVARGDDPTPLRPTPTPAWLRFRPRLDLPAPPSRVVAALPAIAAYLADALRTAGRHARAIRVRVGWERGGGGATELRLRGPTGDARTLAAELRRALDWLLDGDARNERGGGDAVADLRIALGDLAPALPEQTALWRAEAARREALARLAGIGDGMARRHGRAMLRSLRIREPDAIFEERRYRADALPRPGEVGYTIATPRPVPARGVSGVTTPDTWDGVPHGIHWW